MPPQFLHLWMKLPLRQLTTAALTYSTVPPPGTCGTAFLNMSFLATNTPAVMTVISLLLLIIGCMFKHGGAKSHPCMIMYDDGQTVQKFHSQLASVGLHYGYHHYFDQATLDNYKQVFKCWSINVQSYGGAR